MFIFKKQISILLPSKAFDFINPSERCMEAPALVSRLPGSEGSPLVATVHTAQGEELEGAGLWSPSNPNPKTPAV